MKKLLTFSIILLSFFGQAQERSSIAVSYGFGKGSFGSVIKGGSNFSSDNKSLNVFGVSYWHGLNKNLFFETGIQLIRHEYNKLSSYPNNVTTKENLNMISFPFKLRFEAGRHLFFNGGLSADISKSSNIQAVGAGIGIGFQMHFADDLFFYISPQANVHGIIPKMSLFSNSNIIFGISYQINKL